MRILFGILIGIIIGILLSAVGLDRIGEFILVVKDVFVNLKE